MRKLLVQTFVSLDGVMQSPGAPEEDSSQGFTQLAQLKQEDGPTEPTR